MRKIKVATDTPTEYELGDTAADIQKMRKERKQREREEAGKQQREKQVEARKSENSQDTLQMKKTVDPKKRPRTKRSEIEMDTERKDI